MSVPRERYERMLDEMRTELRPQREWGEGRGIFMVVGHFVVGIAAGTWLMSLLFDSRVGLVAAFVLAALGGLAHLAFLGRPERFWRMIARVRTSWVSRGFVGLSLFLAGALLYLAPLAGSTSLWSAASFIAQLGYACALLGMLILIGYMGFVYTASKAVPFWNSPLHPVLYVGHALRGGLAALLVIAAFGSIDRDAVPWLLGAWIAVTVAVALLFAVELHGAHTGGNAAARRSAYDLLGGRLAVHFYAGTLLLGIVLPCALAWSGLNSPASLWLLALTGALSAAGDFFAKYSTIRAGIYLPVWTRVRPR
jgi:formate-dependent nitrite reductase membrane component NrfD